MSDPLQRATEGEAAHGRTPKKGTGRLVFHGTNEPWRRYQCAVWLQSVPRNFQILRCGRKASPRKDLPNGPGPRDGRPAARLSRTVQILPEEFERCEPGADAAQGGTTSRRQAPGRTDTPFAHAASRPAHGHGPPSRSRVSGSPTAANTVSGAFRRPVRKLGRSAAWGWTGWPPVTSAGRRVAGPISCSTLLGPGETRRIHPGPI